MKMKKYLIPFMFLAFLFTGCAEDINETLKEIKVEPSFVSFEQQGGEKSITVTATGDWAITNIPEWLKLDKTSGNAGTTEVKLHTLSAYDNLSQEMYVVVGNSSQTVLVKQAAGELKPITTKEFIENGTDGKTYLIQGAVKNIINTVYGNLYINDGTSDKDAYIYGMLDAKGAEKNFLSLGIEPGDTIVVSGPRSTYKSDIEIVNATLVKIKTKALLGAAVNSYVHNSKAGDYSAPVIVKGDDLTFSTDADWIEIKGTKGSGNDTEILYSITENTGTAPRNGNIALESTKSTKDGLVKTTISISVKQLPATEKKNIGEVNFKDKEYVSVEGVVYAVAKSGLVIKDETGMVFIETSESAEIGATVGAVGASEKKYARNKVVADSVAVSEGTAEVSYPKATAITKDNAATIIKESPAKYGFYSVTGYVTSDKKILVEGAVQTVTAIDPVSDLDLKPFIGECVTATGFYTDNNSGNKQIQLVLVKVEQVKESVPEIFDLPKTTGSIDWNESSLKFQILADANTEWSATLPEDVEGISLSDASGKGSKEISVKFSGLNRTYTAQKVTVTVTAGEESKTFDATRKALVTMAVAGESKNMSVEGGTMKVSITASLYWKLSVSCSNPSYTATLSKTEGLGVDDLVVTFPKNESGEELTYTFTAVDDRVDWQEGFVPAEKPATFEVKQAAEASASANVITLTSEGLPTSYPAEGTDCKLAGKSFKLYNVANFGNGIQMKKDGSFLYNTESLGKIKSVKLNVQTDKTWYASNPKLYAGSEQNPTTEVTLTSSDATGSVYEISGDCGFIKIENPSSYAVYMASIEITVE